MFCPNCKKEILLIMEYDQIELDFCSVCLGVWLDEEELEWILEAEIDEQSIFTKTEVDELKKKCPRCGEYMHKVIVPPQNEIIYDICPNQHGIWFDRGELEKLVQGLPEFPGTHSFLRWLSDVFTYTPPERK